MDSKYTPISRSTISEKRIPVLVNQVKQTIVERLQSQPSVSVTVDIWSDRRLRSFLGVTAHAVHCSNGSCVPEPYLLECRRFTGRHSGERISAAFEEILEEYGITQKVCYIIADNAANMKCAFKVQMPLQQASDTESENDLDDEELWENTDEDTELGLSGERLSCFAHSLQLVVSDGMKEVKSFSLAIAKASFFSTLLHTSSAFKDTFESTCGTTKTVPAANNTRWNSTFKQLQALTSLDHKTLTEMCLNDFSDVVFMPREWNQLRDLTSILAPFAEATNLTEGGKVVTISIIVPTVLDLNTHLIKCETTHILCRPIARALHGSLKKRFQGIFEQFDMAGKTGKEEPFNNKIYTLATMLDPQFGLNWVDLDVMCKQGAAYQRRYREDQKKSLKETLVAEVEKCAERYGGEQDDLDATLEEDDSPPKKCGRMLSRYKSLKKRSTGQQTSVATQVAKYFETIEDTDIENALHFWAKHQESFPQIHMLAMKLLAVPASSAPVERVFSRGGFIMRPHRSRLRHSLLSSLIFLKCNYEILDWEE
ncbi:hypothetical protein PO909_002492 [Leuciscus waleckii]